MVRVTKRPPESCCSEVQPRAMGLPALSLPYAVCTKPNSYARERTDKSSTS